jgi:hypothetical protein
VSFVAPGVSLFVDPDPARRPVQPWTSTILGPALEIPDPVAQMALMAATEALWAKSGRRFGQATITVRPCSPYRGGAFAAGLEWPWLTAMLADTAWNLWPRFWLLPIGCGLHNDDCGCTRVHRVHLGKTPISSVQQVMLDGEVFPPSSYRVDNWESLVRLDGDAWPYCQDMNLDDDQPGTWSVTFTYGATPPVLGQLACGEFAREIALAITRDKSCRLPKRVQSVTRQGVSATMISLQDMLNANLTGLELTDQFILSTNPKGIQSRARIYRADARPPYRRVGTTAPAPASTTT